MSTTTASDRAIITGSRVQTTDGPGTVTRAPHATTIGAAVTVQLDTPLPTGDTTRVYRLQDITLTSLTAHTAARAAGVTVATIRTWCRTGAVTAAKTGGRWHIDSASLTRRLQIGAMRRRTRTAGPDLTATYAHLDAGDTIPQLITPKIRIRTRDGLTLTTIRGLAPLLAERIDAIADPGDRGHTLTTLASAAITISDQPRPDLQPHALPGLIHVRDGGRLSTTYHGTPDLPVSVVLDLAEQLRDTL